MGKNFLQREKEMMQQSLSAGEDIGMNRMLDLVMMVLTDPKYMGKDTIGKVRFMRILEGIKEVDKDYGVAFTSDPEADYQQERVDARWKLLLGDSALSFYKRFPQLKQFDYVKGNKAWRK